MNQARSESALPGASIIAVTAGEVSLDRQAYQILHWGFAALPIIAGLDKFLMLLATWHQYLAPQLNFFGASLTMQIVGVIEMVAGLGVAIKPKLFAPVVAVWLWGIIFNLLLLGSFFDVALRDFGLSLGAIALWRLSQHFDSPARESQK